MELLDIFWVIIASSLVFIMQAGFAMVEAGMTRSKNSINVAVKNLTDLGISSIFFWFVGYGLMFGTSASGFLAGFVGLDHFMVYPKAGKEGAFFLFQIMFCSTSATIVSGAVAERMKFSSYIVSTIILSTFIYPVFGHWAWGGLLEGETFGWLSKIGFVDFAGSTVVHSMGGWIALSILLVLGARTGKYNPDGTSNVINGSNVPMAVLGVLILWFGWFGFNGGSTLAANGQVTGIIINTTLAAASGMVGSLFLGWIIFKKADINMVLNGSLAGLVAITANCHAVTPAIALLIGLIGGIVMISVTLLLDKLKIDDAVGAIPVHLGAGIWGTLAVGLLGDLDMLGTGLSRGQQILVQLAGIGACGAFAFTVSFVSITVINRVSRIRVSQEEEHMGLNKAEHGVTTEILDFYQVLQRQSETGELSLRAPVEPFTEIGQIATIYNLVMDRLETAHNDYVSILDNVSDGLFLLNPDGTIGGQYSSALETIFESKNIGGNSLVNLLAPHVSSDVIENTRDFLELTFDPAKVFRMVERFNPLCENEFIFDMTGGGHRTKHLQFLFKRIEKGGTIAHVMVLVRDITKQKELAIEVEENRRQTNAEMELFYKILYVEPDMLAEFLESAKEEITLINTALSQSTETPRDILTRIFRNAHTVKGDADMLGLDFIASKAQELESEIAALTKKTDLEGNDFLGLLLKLNEVNGAVEKITAVLGKWNLHSTSGSVSAHDPLENGLSQLVSRLSERHEKDVVLSCDTKLIQEQATHKRKKIQNILVQLVRNSMYHGIEAPDERVAKGKARAGSITIKTLRHGDDTLTIHYSDDGAGLNAEKIRARAIVAGLVSEERAGAMTEKELFPMIFQSNFSTADSVDTTAGRGVGMDLVRTTVQDLGGRISLGSKRDLGLRIEIQMPIEKA